MTTALTPIINQMQTDSDRLRALVNGTENDTVELENRTSKSVAGLVKEAIDTSAIDLNNAVQSAQSSATDAANSKTAAAQSETNTATAKASVDLTKSQIDTIKTDIDTIKTDIDLKYDEINTAKDDIDAKYGEIQTFRNETEVFANDVTEKSDQVANTLVQTQELSSNVAQTASELREESSRFSTYIKKPEFIYPTQGGKLNPAQTKISIGVIYDAYDYMLDNIEQILKLYTVDNTDPSEPIYTKVAEYTFSNLTFDMPYDFLEDGTVYAVTVQCVSTYVGREITSPISEYRTFTVDPTQEYVEQPQVISSFTGPTSFTPTITFSPFNTSNGVLAHTNTDVAVLDRGKKLYRFTSDTPVESFIIPEGVLEPGRTYQVFFAYIDGNLGLSPLSDIFEFGTAAPIERNEFDTLESRVDQHDTDIAGLQVDYSDIENNRTLAEQAAMDASDYRDQTQQLYNDTVAASSAAYTAQGVWDVSTGAYPTVPSTNSQWYVVGAADSTGTDFDNETWFNGDTLLYTVDGAMWLHVANDSPVTSVNGKNGDVVVTKDDVGLSNVRNVSSYSQTESDNTFANLDGGADANFSVMPQVGGSAIIDTVQNANGVAIRYSSGYMECFFTSPTVYTTSTNLTQNALNQTNIYRSAEVILTFPVAFVGRPTVTEACEQEGENATQSATGFVWGQKRRPTSAGITMSLMSYSSSATGRIGYVAKGFWK